MPTYQYQCNACGEALEIHQSFSDDALSECPACGGQLRKLFNAVGVVFKGSGFYRTDSRASSPSTSSTSGSDSSGSAASSDSAKAGTSASSSPASSSSASSSSTSSSSASSSSAS